MNPKDIFYTQYTEHKLHPRTSKSILEKIFHKFYIHREDLAISLLDSGNRLLDIGCGDGLLLIKARNKYKSLYGIDIVFSRVEQAKENFRNAGINDFTAKKEDFNEGLDFEDSFFDAVTMIATLSFIYDPFYSLKEINRVLKKGGLFIIQVSNIAYIKYRIKLLFGKLPITTSPYNWESIGWDGGSLHYFTLSSLKWLLEYSGFKVEEVKCSGLFSRLRSIWPSLFGGDICIKARKIK